MHIMHIVGNFGPGGAEMGVVRLTRALSCPPFRHSVCSISSDIRMKHYLSPEVNCYTLGIDGPARFAFKSLLSFFKAAKVDIAHVNNIAPWFDVALASKISGIRCIQTFHGVEDNTLKFSFLKKLQLFCSWKLSDRLSSVSASSARLLSALSGIDEKHIGIIDNGIDTDFFSPVSQKEKKKIRSALGLPEDKIILGCVAALRDVKNHKGLLAAFSKLVRKRQDSLLVLVGDGPLAKDLKQQSTAFKIEDSVVFTGQRDDIDQYLKVFDAFVLNSKTEGLSYAILEAMSSGLPVVATDVGGNLQIIDHGLNGILYRQGDEGQLSTALKALLEDPEKIERMGEEARKKILKSYSLDRMVKEYDLFYKGLL